LKTSAEAKAGRETQKIYFILL